MYFLLILQGMALGNYLSPEPKQVFSSCTSYSCAPASVTKPSKLTCISEASSSSYYLWPCSSGSSCNLTSNTCELSVVTTSISYVGEPCTSTSDCYLSTCVNLVCRGLSLNSACTSHYQCDIGYRCSSTSSTCQVQIPVGGTGCRTYLDCVNWATCNVSISGSSKTGTCVAYSSVGFGVAVSDCENGFSYMCASGACNKGSPFSTTGNCIFPPVSEAKLPKVCKTSLDCTGMWAGQVITSECGCGVNANGTSYCQPFIGDYPGQMMLYVWKNALLKTGMCNTARRSAQKCLEMIGLYKNTTQATLMYYNYPLYQNNDLCVKSIINANYWMEGAFIINGFIALVLLYV